MVITLFTWNINGLRSVFKPPTPFSSMKPTNKRKSSDSNALDPPTSFSMNNVTSTSIPPLAVFPSSSLSEFLNEWNIDILCLQETKLSSFTSCDYLIHLPKHDSFHTLCMKPKGYSGVATYTVQGSTKASFTGDTKDILNDHEGRAMITDHEDFVLINLYCPNGGRNLDYKFQFYQSLIQYLQQLLEQKREIIVCGDFNIAHHPIDLWNATDLVGCIGFSAEERALLDTFESIGLIDIFRFLHPNDKKYTFWDPKTHRRTYDLGWRIDTFWITRTFVNLVESVEILSQIYGSDHCPVKLVLKGSLPTQFPTPETATNRCTSKQSTLHSFFSISKSETLKQTKKIKLEIEKDKKEKEKTHQINKDV